jgi:hypothetical protein
MAVVFLVVFEALQSCERPLAFVFDVLPPLPTEPAPVLASLEVLPFPTEPAPVLVLLAAPLPEFVPVVPEFVPVPEPLPELLLSPELLPEFAAIAEVARPIENTVTARSFNIVSSMDCSCFAIKQPRRMSDVPRRFFCAVTNRSKRGILLNSPPVAGHQALVIFLNHAAACLAVSLYPNSTPSLAVNLAVVWGRQRLAVQVPAKESEHSSNKYKI